jgi:xyloglucan:xyloglucosyl transferase
VAALLGARLAVATATKFDDVVQPSWANDHVVYEGDLLKLRLDSNSGGGPRCRHSAADSGEG